MTKPHDEVVSWMAEVEADPRYQLEEAAADLALEISQILLHAFRARPDIDQKMLAECLGVTEGRVSQVLHGDGNIHVATAAKYMRALGYRLSVHPRSVEVDSPPLVRNTRRKVVAHVYKTAFADPEGISEHYTSFVTASPTPREALERPRHVGSLSLSAAKREYVEDVVPAAARESRPKPRERAAVS